MRRVGMRQSFRAVAWCALGLVALALAASVLVRSWLAGTSAEFDRWVGWANVWALLVGAVALAVVAWEKAVRDQSSSEVLQTVDELAAVVLAEARAMRARLLGTDEPQDRGANVRFVRGSGRFREVGGAATGDLESVLEYYRSLAPARLVVLGEAGAGKTVLALELMVRLLEDRAASREGPVPVLVSAAAWDTGAAWEEWLAGHLAGRFGMSAAQTARWVRDRLVLPVVDGMDEMDPANPVEGGRRAETLVRALNAYMAGRLHAPVVVTCRQTEYDLLPTTVDRATRVAMVPLTGDESRRHLLGQLQDERARERWRPVLDELRAHPDGLLAVELSTPWRLTLALAVFSDEGDPADLLPGFVQSLDGPGSLVAVATYRARLRDLLLDRYVIARVRLHGPAGSYSPDRVTRWLEELAAGLATQARQGGSATDIDLSSWWRQAARGGSRATHMLLAVVPAMVWAAACALYDSIDGLFMVAYFIPFFFIAASDTRPHRLNVRALATLSGMRRFARGFSSGLASGLAAGLVIGLMVALIVGLRLVGHQEFAYGMAYGVTYGLTQGLTLALTLGVVLGLVQGLSLGSDDPRPRVVRPRQVVGKDGLYGSVVGLAGGLTVALTLGLTGGIAVAVSDAFRFGNLDGLSLGLLLRITDSRNPAIANYSDDYLEELFLDRLTYGLSAGLPYGLAYGFFYGITLALAFSGRAWVRYRLAMALAAARGTAPWRFGAFLDWAHLSGILRVSGIAYQFRHRQLQEHLTPADR